MQLIVTSSNVNGIYASYYANGNAEVTIAANTSILINLTAGDTFVTPLPTSALGALGLSITNSGMPHISGTPTGSGNVLVSVNTGVGIRTLNISVSTDPDTAIIISQPQCDCTGIVHNVLSNNIVDPTIEGRGIVEYFLNTGTIWIKLAETTSVYSGVYTGIDLCCIQPGVYEVKAIYTVRQLPNCNNTSPIIFQAIYVKSYTILAYKPILNLVANEPFSSSEEACCKIIVGESITITPAAILNRPNSCTVLDDNSNPVAAVLNYKLYDYNGTLVERVQFVLNEYTDPATIVYTFTPSSIGDYKVIGELITCCGTEEFDLLLPACNYVLFSGACHTYNFHNASLARTIVLALYQKDGVTLIDGYPINIAPNSGYQLTVTDGVYIAKITQGSDTFYYPIIDHCNMRACLANFIYPILCAGESTTPIKGDSEEDARFILNKMLAYQITYFNLLNTIYGFNNLYTALTPSLITTLFELSDIQTIISKYCDSNCTQVVDMKGGCGCN